MSERRRGRRLASVSLGAIVSVLCACHGGDGTGGGGGNPAGTSATDGGSVAEGGTATGGRAVDTGGSASGGGGSSAGTSSETGGRVPSTGGRVAAGGEPTDTGGSVAGGGEPTENGGSVASAGSEPTGAGGTSGAGVDRPAYNTGTGFFVKDGVLYDANGVEFRIRGVNKLHFDAPSPGIAKTGANTERWVIDFNGVYGATPRSNLVLMQETIANRVVPMPGSWDGTCEEDPATLSAIVDTWIEQASTWQTVDPQMILNIANEWGPEDSTVWRDSYVSAVTRLREAGYTCTIAVDAGGCGQDNAGLIHYAQAVFDADPQKNVIFGQHIYGNWAYDGQEGSWQVGLNKGLDALASTGLVVFIGEFGPGENIGPSPTDLTPADVIQAAEAHGFGWMAWAWDDPAYDPDLGWFAMSMGAQSPYNGDYTSSDDLTPYGRVVVESPGFGLLALGTPATSL
jgi:hypothetical protein